MQRGFNAKWCDSIERKDTKGYERINSNCNKWLIAKYNQVNY